VEILGRRGEVSDDHIALRTELEKALQEDKDFYDLEDFVYDKLNIEKQRKIKAYYLKLGTKLENFKWDLEYKDFKETDLDEVYR
jgi:hypothetical protein